ncbi:hypothetical protein HY488_01430 [Candidatus Woesearchaeota archaeon]|nr:hypothetical protein [Candidatus Woesearchaeota archaeon]
MTKAEQHALKIKRQHTLEKKFWRYFLLIKTVILIIIFTMLAIAVWRFLRVLKG